MRCVIITTREGKEDALSNLTTTVIITMASRIYIEGTEKEEILFLNAPMLPRTTGVVMGRALFLYLLFDQDKYGPRKHKKASAQGGGTERRRPTGTQHILFPYIFFLLSFKNSLLQEPGALTRRTPPPAPASCARQMSIKRLASSSARHTISFPCFHGQQQQQQPTY